MSDEVWKQVPSLNGVTVSSYGRIKLPSRTAKMPHGGIRHYYPKATYGCKVKASKNARHVYCGISTKFFGNIKVHRAVCEAFHGEPPFEGAIVIHLDEDSTNNRPDNLKWGTQKENLNMPKFIEYCKSRTGKNSPSYKGKINKKIQEQSLRR